MRLVTAARFPVAARERLGAVIIAVTLLVPLVFALLVELAIDDPRADDVVQFGLASTRLGIKLLAAVFCAAAVWLFTARERATTLRALAGARALAAAALFGVLFVEVLQNALVSAALAAVEIAFATVLLRFVAARFAKGGNVALARNTREYVWLYAAARVVLLFVWLLPPEHAALVGSLFKTVAPLLEGVIALLVVWSVRKTVTDIGTFG